MKELPIIFSGPMVRAILDGRKTQTRRVIDIGPDWRFEGIYEDAEAVFSRPNRIVMGREVVTEHCAVRMKYQPGDRLYVRETWGHDGPDMETVRRRLEDAIPFVDTYGPFYRATEAAPDTIRWRPSIHMPKWAARIWLEVTGVRVERLQDISYGDCVAEGVSYLLDEQQTDAEHINWTKEQYRALWDSLNAKRAPWDSNPWVWAIEFPIATPSTGGS